MADSIGRLIRELGDLALKNMTREQLEKVAMFDVHAEESAPNFARLAEGLGCLIAQDASDKADVLGRSGALQGADSISVFAAIGEIIEIIGAVGYVTNYAASKLLQPATYGGPIEETSHA